MEAAQAENAQITDEASAMERLGLPVRLVECGDVNLKITTATDMVLAEAVLRARSAQERADPAPRVGLGYDVHRLVPGAAPGALRRGDPLMNGGWTGTAMRTSRSTR